MENCYTCILKREVVNAAKITNENLFHSFVSFLLSVPVTFLNIEMLLTLM